MYEFSKFSINKSVGYVSLTKNQDSLSPSKLSTHLKTILFNQSFSPQPRNDEKYVSFFFHIEILNSVD